jgi:hypothetical protein
VSSRRARRVNVLTEALTKAAIGWKVQVRHYSPEEVTETFGVRGKEARAKCITEILPELEPYLPAKPLLWQPQHPQMQMFDAVSLALTYCYLDT